MVAYQVKNQGHSKLGAIIVTAAVVAALGGVWVKSRGGPDGPQGTTAVAGPAAPAPPEPTPREQADKLLGEGLRLVKSGKTDAALGKLRAANAADPTYGEPHLHQAALHAKTRQAFKAIGALEAFLGVEDDGDAVAARIATDPDFVSLAQDKDFQGWLFKKGLREGPPPGLAIPPSAAPKKTKKTKRRKKRALEVPEF
jgi:hypothetical protein